MKQSKSSQLVVVEKRGASALFQAPVPAIVVHDGPRTVKRFLEFFAAQIRNPNTRAAYARASARFFDWCLDRWKVLASSSILSRFTWRPG